MDNNGRNWERTGTSEAGVNAAWGELTKENLAEGIRQAEQELQRDVTEVEHREEFVGEESAIQIDEHAREDAEDAKNEAGEGLGFENRIVAKNQESVARAIAPEVEKLTRQKSFVVSELERTYRRGVNSTLAVFGRRIGDRN